MALNVRPNSVQKAAFRLNTPHPSRSNPTLTNPQIQWIPFSNPMDFVFKSNGFYFQIQWIPFLNPLDLCDKASAIVAGVHVAFSQQARVLNAECGLSVALLNWMPIQFSPSIPPWDLFFYRRAIVVSMFWNCTKTQHAERIDYGTVRSFTR